MTIRKLIFIGILITVTIICLMFLVPWQISKSFSAFEVKLPNWSVESRRMVSITGRYYINCLGPDVFDGNISVSGFPITDQDIYIYIEDDSYPLIYLLENGSSYSFGSLFTNRFLRCMYITVYEHPDTNRLDRASFDERTGTVLFLDFDTMESAHSVWDSRKQ